MNSNVFISDLSACAGFLAAADLADWQVVAEVQGRFSGLVQAAPASAQGILATCAAKIDELFTTELAAAKLDAVRSELLTLLAELCSGSPNSATGVGGSDDYQTTAALSEPVDTLIHPLTGLISALEDLVAKKDHAREDFLSLANATAQQFPDDISLVVAKAVEACASDRPIPVTALTQALAWLHVRTPQTNESGEDSDRVTVVLARLAAANEQKPHAAAPKSPAQSRDASLAEGGPLPAEASPETASEFLTEAGEYVQTIERLMLAIEGAPTADNLNGIFRAFHTIKGLAGFLHLRRIQVLAHASEDLLDRLRNGKVAIDRPAVDLLLTALDQLKLLLEGLGEALGNGILPPSPDLPDVVLALRTAAHVSVPLGALLVANGIVDQETVDAALAAQRHLQPDRRLGDILVEAGQVTPHELAATLAQQTPVATTATPHASVVPPATMRVDIARVDALNDAIGELVIAQNMVSCSPEIRALGSRRVQALLAQLDRVTRSIQDMSMRLRLVSIQPVFQRMVRLGRDTSKAVGKSLEIITEGEDQELDKSVVERLGDPLVHLVRNAIDHGLETTEGRLAAGKPAAGRVTLRAYRRAGAFCVEISDDGRGLDRTRILAKARERELVREGQVLRDDEILNLIFLPGFSTVEKVTDLSGRGVGMDVVRRMVEDMRGQVILTSEPGKGTTVTILLPLTLAIIDGMEIGVADQRYILPTLSVVTSMQSPAESLHSVQGQGQMLEFAGHQMPLFDLRSMFGCTDAPAVERPLVVVVEDGNRRAGLMVDAIHGRHQVVVKTMSPGLPPAPGIGGATIGGDGRVCLVCDIPGLIQLANSL